MLLLHRWAGLTRPNAVSHRWASGPPPPVALNHAIHTSGRWGLPMHAKPLTPGLPHRLVLRTSSRQISNVYLWGILVWRLSYALLLLGGTLGSDHSRARSPSPGQHVNNVFPYSPNTHYVYRANICKCEIVKLCFINKVREEHVRYSA